jgi:amidophosphoribosyltransferase
MMEAKEACGVFGVFAPGRPVAHLTFDGLYALQHRGQESAGMAVSDGDLITVMKDMGLVTTVFDERKLSGLRGHMAIGHTRYSTAGSSDWMNAQPVFRGVGRAGFGLGHNGNLTNTAALAESAGMLPGLVASDSDLVAELLARAFPPDLPERSRAEEGDDLEQALMTVLPDVEGAFSFVLLDADRLIGVRDPNGFRPLCLGRLDATEEFEQGWVLASESPALDVIGATFIRELEPGEMVVIDGKEVRSERPFPVERLDPKLCIFEFVYFARPDTTLYGNEVHGARRRMGQLLATQAPVPADLVMGVPDSGVPAAEGYAVASGIPYGQGLVKNRYIGRTFIAPTQAERANGVRRKLNPLRENITGKRLIVVDDSIVRGTTTRAMVTMLREAGATEVHLRISSPPFRWPCYYGIDTPDRNELLASVKTPEEIVEFLDVDSLEYLSGSPGAGHRRPRRRLLRRLPDRPLPGARPCAVRRAGRAERGRRRSPGVTGPAPDPSSAASPPVSPAAAPGPTAAPADAPTATPATYAGAGVDIDAGERAVDLIKPLVAATLRPEVLGGLGDFGGLFALDSGRYRQPVLVAGTDGVGTKAVVAQAVGRFDTIGIDLVAMCVDDLVCQGAEPLFVLDYISSGVIDPSLMAELVAGVAEGCRQVGAALLGGEMAEHSGVMKPGEFDLVGFAVGVVEREAMLGAPRVEHDDVLIGLVSPGLRCNGYTLARHVLLERAGLPLDGPAWPGAEVTLADELLRPSVLYAPAVRAALTGRTAGAVHAIAHVTGGGFEGNLPRALPDHLDAVVDRGAWEVPAIFGEIRRLGHVDDTEMSRVFNLGLGMVAVVAADRADDTVAVLGTAGVPSAVVGHLETRGAGSSAPRVRFVGPPFWTGASPEGAGS